MTIAALAVLGVALGHLARRMTPALLGMDQPRMPFRWPWVEAAGAAAFVWAGLTRGAAIDQWKWLVLAALLLAIASADQHSKYIPGKVCYAGVVLGVALSALYPLDIMNLLGQERFLAMLDVPAHWVHLGGGLLAALGTLVGWMQMEFIRRVFGQLARMEVMGSGDALLMAMTGAFLGPQAVLFALLPACLIGVLIGGVAKLRHNSVHFPFGPALAVGSLAMAFHGDRFIDGVRAFHGALYGLPPLALMGLSLALIALLVYLVLRLKRKAALYEQLIEDDYRKTDEKMKK